MTVFVELGSGSDGHDDEVAWRAQRDGLSPHFFQEGLEWKEYKTLVSILIKAFSFSNLSNSFLVLKIK